jgi:hypothetical protein
LEYSTKQTNFEQSDQQEGNGNGVKEWSCSNRFLHLTIPFTMQFCKLTFLSLLLSSFYCSVNAQVYISEVLYNSPGLDDEWIEICNDGATTVDLSLWDIAYQTSEFFEFPSGTMLAAGTCITVALGDDGEADGFNDCNGNGSCGGVFVPDFDATDDGVNTAGGVDNAIANGNGPYTLELRDGSDAVVSTLAYTDDDGADGDGFSQKFDSNGQFVVASSGTPGFQLEPCSGLNAGDLIITEIMVDEASGQDEWFEIYNNTAGSIDLVGITVADDSNQELISNATPITVAAGGYAVIALNGNTGCGASVADYTINTFGLRNSGDVLSLFCDGTLIDEVDFSVGFSIVEGEALNFNADLLDGTNDDIENDDPNNWCLATTDCTPNELGTPGLANTSCSVSNCPTDLTDADLLDGTGNIPDGSYQAANDITTSGIVVSGATVVLDAGNSITLTDGFTAESGSTFTAMIGGCSATAPALPAVEARSTTSHLEAIRIYPNPVRQQGVIEVDLSTATTVTAQLFDLNGRLLQTLLPTQSMTAGQHDINYSVAHIAAGTYFVQLQLNGTRQMRKLVVLE